VNMVNQFTRNSAHQQPHLNPCWLRLLNQQHSHPFPINQQAVRAWGDKSKQSAIRFFGIMKTCPGKLASVFRKAYAVANSVIRNSSGPGQQNRHW
jgi:hypothetical protein